MLGSIWVNSVSRRSLHKLREHRENLLACDLCPQMVGPVVSGLAVISKVMLVGQAPGPKEGQFGKPFAWTAGRTMFGWFASIGLEEEHFRQNVYMAAVCRCFPGKNPKGGDRVPDATEIANCSSWLQREMELLKPELVIPVGKLAISQFVDCSRLTDIIGQTLEVSYAGHQFEMIALPHPSGASTWHRMEPGKSLLREALCLIGRHPAFPVLDS